MSDVTELFRVDGDGVVLEVLVQPRAGRTAVAGRHGVALKVRVTAPPLDDRANEAAADALAAAFGVPRRAVELVAGARSRRKRFRIGGVEPAAVASRLEALVAPDGASG